MRISNRQFLYWLIPLLLLVRHIILTSFFSEDQSDNNDAISTDQLVVPKVNNTNNSKLVLKDLLVQSKINNTHEKKQKRHRKHPLKVLGNLVNLGFCSKWKPKSKAKAEIKEYVENIDFQHIDTYVMFWGFPRSGHTWIGAILDAGPNALIANEFNALGKFKDSKVKSRDSFFRKLAYNSHLCGRYGRVHVYNYTIPGLWQGKVAQNTSLKVIGDKMGGSTTYAFLEMGARPWSNNSSAVSQKIFLESFLNLTAVKYLKMILVLRNPFNMIATQALRAGAKYVDGYLVHKTLTYFKQNMWARENLSKRNDWIVFTMEKFATNTRQILIELCSFTNVTCPPQMIEKVIKQTQHVPHDTWPSVIWRKEDINIINSFIQQHLIEYYSPIPLKQFAANTFRYTPRINKTWE